jgi:mono/diheme cytochrome c family protein
LASPEHKRALAVVAAAALVILASGCGGEEPDLEHGKRLFTGEGRCGNCHVLQRAGTKATIGPSLDAALGQARADGLDAKTLEGVVYDQILNPRNASAMPADLVTGKDARDVAAYVAEAARRPGEDEGGVGELAGSDPTAEEGRALFLSKGCGGCHILSDAKTGASEGPTLNDLRSAARVKGGLRREYIERAILDPNKEIVGGFRPNLMPSNYEDKLTDKELDTLVDYLIRVTR